MAENKGQQGTGRHPHKSTDEPWSHTKEEDAQHGRSHDSSRDDGNHSHGGSHQPQSSRQDHDHAEEADLKRREYRGADGEMHHHTRTYMEEHGGSHDDRNADHRSHGGDDNRPHGKKR